MKNERQDFTNPHQALNWLFAKCTNPTQLEVLHGEMIFNHVFTGKVFVHLRESNLDVIYLDNPN